MHNKILSYQNDKNGILKKNTFYMQLISSIIMMIDKFGRGGGTMFLIMKIRFIMMIWRENYEEMLFQGK